MSRQYFIFGQNVAKEKTEIHLHCHILAKKEFPMTYRKTRLSGTNYLLILKSK
jgi:hypothetical protein